MGIKIVHVEDVQIYDGYDERCFLDAASVDLNFNNLAEVLSITTDGDGQLPEAGMIVNAAHPNVRVVVTKPGYSASVVKTKVTWDGDSGYIALQAIYMEKKK